MYWSRSSVTPAGTRAPPSAWPSCRSTSASRSRWSCRSRDRTTAGAPAGVVGVARAWPVAAGPSIARGLRRQARPEELDGAAEAFLERDLGAPPEHLAGAIDRDHAPSLLAGLRRAVLRRVRAARQHP